MRRQPPRNRQRRAPAELAPEVGGHFNYAVERLRGVGAAVQQQPPRGDAARVRVARRGRRAHGRQRPPAPGGHVQHVRVVQEGALRGGRVGMRRISRACPATSM